jgi:hypothetical protein
MLRVYCQGESSFWCCQLCPSSSLLCRPNAVAAVFPVASYFVVGHDIRVLEDVLKPTAEPDQSYFNCAIAIEARKLYDAIPKAEAEAFKQSVAAPR